MRRNVGSASSGSRTAAAANGAHSATPVSEDYGPRDSKFNGRITWVQLDIGDDAEDVDNLITPEERYRVAMARQ